MRYHFFLHYGWFLQNFEKDFIPTLLHTTVTLAQGVSTGDIPDKTFPLLIGKRFDAIQTQIIVGNQFRIQENLHCASVESAAAASIFNLTD